MEILQLSNDIPSLPLVLAVDHSLLAVYYLVPQVRLLQTRPGGREGEEGKVIQDLSQQVWAGQLG